MTDLPTVNVAAIILAAGDSERMGSPKALLDFAGKPLIERVLETAKAGGCAKFIVVLGREADAIKAGADLEGCMVLVNEDPSRGQLSSIQLGMANLDFATDCCVVWPVDCPLIEPADVEALVTEYGKLRASLMRIFLPVHNGERGHPVLIDLGFRQPFMELKPGQTARKVAEDNPTQVKEVLTENAGVLVDINTPEEYKSAAQEFTRRR